MVRFFQQLNELDLYLTFNSRTYEVLRNIVHANRTIKKYSVHEQYKYTIWIIWKMKKVFIQLRILSTFLVQSHLMYDCYLFYTCALEWIRCKHLVYNKFHVVFLSRRRWEFTLFLLFSSRIQKWKFIVFYWPCWFIFRSTFSFVTLDLS